MESLYDTIGTHYSNYRRPDPRITTALSAELGQAGSIVNIGAGVGSYEPRDREFVVAVEPSGLMISQRAKSGPPVVQARAESLPFRDAAFDAATAILTIHHWSDVDRGLLETRRVARDRVVLLTRSGFGDFWLLDYLPQIREIEEPLFPSIDELTHLLGPVRVTPLPIPHDCTDGFLCAYWRRPHSYLDEEVRGAISTFSRVLDIDAGLRRLEEDLNTGAWHNRYSHLLQTDSVDFGYRLVVWQREAA